MANYGNRNSLDSLETIKLGRQNKYKPETKKSETDFRAEISRNLQKLREQRMAYDELKYRVKVPKPPQEIAPGVGAGDVNQTASTPEIPTKEADQEIVAPVREGMSSKEWMRLKSKELLGQNRSWMMILGWIVERIEDGAVP